MDDSEHGSTLLNSSAVSSADDRYFYARVTHPLHAHTIFDVKFTQLAAIIPDVNTTIGKHTVDI